MDALIWNIRSVNAKKAFERLVTMHRKYHFEIVGLMEPMQKVRKLEIYRKKIGLAQAFANISNNVWAFIDKLYDATIMYDTVQHLTLKLFHT